MFEIQYIQTLFHCWYFDHTHIKKLTLILTLLITCYPMFFTNVFLILHATTMYAVTYLFPRAAIVKHSCTSHSLFIQSSYWQIPQNHSPMRITQSLKGKYKYKYTRPNTYMHIRKTALMFCTLVHPHACSIRNVLLHRLQLRAPSWPFAKSHRSNNLSQITCLVYLWCFALMCIPNTYMLFNMFCDTGCRSCLTTSHLNHRPQQR